MKSKHSKLFKNENKYYERSTVKIKQYQNTCFFFNPRQNNKPMAIAQPWKSEVTRPGFLTANMKKKTGYN